MKIALSAVLAGCFLIGGATSAFAITAYEIEVAYNDELFIINGEKYEAKTYCLGWEEDEKVMRVLTKDR